MSPSKVFSDNHFYCEHFYCESYASSFKGLGNCANGFGAALLFDFQPLQRDSASQVNRQQDTDYCCDESKNACEQNWVLLHYGN